MEFIPYIGPIIGPAPAVLVALFNDPISAVWVILLFVALQQLEGHFVAPQVFRISLRINPILIILSLLIGYQLYGIVGALVALPMAAVIRQSVVYLRRHLVLEPWGVVVPATGLPALETERCPECGAPSRPGDSFCRSVAHRCEPRVRLRGSLTARVSSTTAPTSEQPAHAARPIAGQAVRRTDCTALGQLHARRQVSSWR